MITQEESTRNYTSFDEAIETATTLVNGFRPFGLEITGFALLFVKDGKDMATHFEIRHRLTVGSIEGNDDIAFLARVMQLPYFVDMKIIS